MSRLSFVVCPRCGTRNFARIDSVVRPDFCISCSPRPSTPAYNVRVEALRHTDDGPVVHYRLRIIDLTGEVVFSREPMGRDEARALALEVSEHILDFVERQEAGSRSVIRGLGANGKPLN